MIVKDHQAAGSAPDPEPATPTEDSIRVAESLREAIRHRLLKRAQPQPDPYWVVGAD